MKKYRILMMFCETNIRHCNILTFTLASKDNVMNNTNVFIREEEGWKDEETTETLDEKTNIVPLCWTDQVSKMDAKVVQSRLPQQRRPEPVRM